MGKRPKLTSVVNNENSNPNVRSQQYKDLDSRTANALMVQNEIYTQHYSNRDDNNEEELGFSQLSWTAASKSSNHKEMSSQDSFFQMSAGRWTPSR